MKKLVMSSFVALALLGSVLMPGVRADAAETGQSIIRVNEQASVAGPDRFFTGTARIDRLYQPTGQMRSRGSSITFEPGARTHWHSHPVGQVLIITDGVGLTQEWGKPVQEIHPGDVVICPVGIKHWHGASPNKFVTTLEVTEENEPGKPAEWFEPVSDEQYAGK